MGRNSRGGLLGFQEIVTNGLFDRLLSLNPNSFKSKLKLRWQNLRLNSFSESNLINIFDFNFAALADCKIIVKENQIWGAGLDLNNEKSYIHSWITNRVLFLDSYFNSL